MTDTLYRTILADPPWDINQRGNVGAERHYPLMSLAGICALPVGELAEADDHLWLCVTNGTLFAGKEGMEAWGFTYRSILTWVKPTFGLGHFLRTASEHLLLGTRGNAPILYRSQPTWLFAPRQEHSHKPEEQYAVSSAARQGRTWSCSPDGSGPVGMRGATRSRAMSSFRPLMKGECRCSHKWQPE